MIFTTIAAIALFVFGLMLIIQAFAIGVVGFGFSGKFEPISLIPAGFGALFIWVAVEVFSFILSMKAI